MAQVVVVKSNGPKTYSETQIQWVRGSWNAEKDLDNIVDSKLDMGLQHTMPKRANAIQRINYENFVVHINYIKS